MVTASHNCSYRRAMRSFGGEDADLASCPPELAGEQAVVLPTEREKAEGILRQCGRTMDPRRIDTYQLGVLLCRLLTGESIIAYMYSPVVKAKVPQIARAVLAQMLGDEVAAPLFDGDQLVAALDDVVRLADTVPTPGWMQEPAQGSTVAAAGNRPNVADLPFDRLKHFRHRPADRPGRDG